MPNNIPCNPHPLNIPCSQQPTHHARRLTYAVNTCRIPFRASTGYCCWGGCPSSTAYGAYGFWITTHRRILTCSPTECGTIVHCRQSSALVCDGGGRRFMNTLHGLQLQHKDMQKDPTHKVCSSLIQASDSVGKVSHWSHEFLSIFRQLF